ncbi:hypothetical protein FQN52_002543 [Onygenales sp. PD_12]|nr:hypothetical protein FQN52_002543 [Onygenales sp. PD_12]
MSATSSLSCAKYQMPARSSAINPQSLQSWINFASVEWTVTGVPRSPRPNTTPTQKLSVANLREGLRPMDFWQEVVQPDRAPGEEPEKSRYNAVRLFRSAIVQESHVMIQEGPEYSCLTHGRMDAQLRATERHSNLESDSSQTVVVELTPDLNVDDANSEFASPEQTTSEYLPSSSPVTISPRGTTRAATTCAPPSRPS